ncbi:AAA family ATPase [Solibacillus sp. FSL H8-0538]|uniref:AAA family ATPase n=1 Tax=Solibacillus sp. FSL H8-0538 TaxID=2921400 RepID=UPI0030F65043
MRKKAFADWLTSIGLSTVTIGNYLRGIRYTEEKFSHLSVDGYLNVYELNDAAKLDRILQNESFRDYDKKGNRMCSSGLKKYQEFLISTNLSNSEEGIMPSNLEDVVLIKINKSYKANMTPEELYKATSVSWVASFEKTDKRDIKHYCAIYQNKIIEVYDFLGSEEEIPKRTPSRFILHGNVADEKIRQKLMYLDVSSIHKGSGNPIKYTSLDTLLQLKENPDALLPNPMEDEDEFNEEISVQQIPSSDLIPHIHQYITSKGFNYSLSNIKNLYLSLRSKPFVIISGISGTGKTKIVQLFAESVGATEENEQFKLIPVRPDWSDSSELLGYTDIKGEFVEGPMTKLVKHALAYSDHPHFLLLDEMNLARVEYYFSDVLSIMESRRKVDDEFTSSTLIELQEGEKLTLPGNVYIIGTVNMDETTHPFSKKVLDRANTIEFNEINLSDFGFLTSAENVEPVQLANSSLQADYIQLKDAIVGHEDIVREVSTELEKINAILQVTNAQVGYRVRDEICFYMIHNQEGSLLDKNIALDFCYMQKILPRISGTGESVEKVLAQLYKFLTDREYSRGEYIDFDRENYPQSVKKVVDMLRRLKEDGFTSFWVS